MKGNPSPSRGILILTDGALSEYEESFNNASIYMNTTGRSIIILLAGFEIFKIFLVRTGAVRRRFFISMMRCGAPKISSVRLGSPMFFVWCRCGAVREQNKFSWCAPVRTENFEP